jgi:hypothetical protein
LFFRIYCVTLFTRADSVFLVFDTLPNIVMFIGKKHAIIGLLEMSAWCVYGHFSCLLHLLACVVRANSPFIDSSEVKERLMEEKQIQEFVHRAYSDESLRTELADNFDDVMQKESFSPRVANVLKRLTPQLLAHEGTEGRPGLEWWTIG